MKTIKHLKHLTTTTKTAFFEFQKHHRNNFTILSSNIESIHSKFEVIQSYVDFFSWLVGWLCLTSHRQRGHLETAPPFTVPCEGREDR